MHSQTAALIIVSAVLPTTASVAVALRVLAKHMRKNKQATLIASDHLVFVALFLTWALSVTAICGATIARIGTPPLEQSSTEFESFLKVMFAVQFFYIFSVGTVKLSVLAFYRSIFITKGFRLACDIISGVVIAWLVALFLGTLLRSNPISVNWNPKQPGGHHGNVVVLFSFVGASDIVLDLIILCLPLPVIRSLHMSTRRKWLIAGIFWLGGFCVISSTVRLAFVIKFVAGYTGLGSYYSSLVVNNLIWMIIEPCASVIAACLPTFGPLFRDGRSPGSIIRSIRSVLSFRSQSSNSSSSGSRKRSAETVSDSEHGDAGARIQGIDYGSYSTHVRSKQQDEAELESGNTDPGIRVLRETDVSSRAPGQES